MQDKAVVFIAGSSYCGSTVLDLMLSNTPGGFSLGEVSAHFYPYRAHHFVTRCACGDNACQVWKNLTRGVSPDEFHLRAFDKLPNTNYLVDSSKDPLWIAKASECLRAQGVSVHHILVWKTPWQYHQSCVNRGREKGWERAWTNYHRLYLSVVDDWVSVSCSDMVGGGDMLRVLCEHLNIPYHGRQKEYWRKSHHTLYGNHSARQHLYRHDSAVYRESREILEKDKSQVETLDDTHQYMSHLELGEQILPTQTEQPKVLGNMVNLLQLRQLQSGGQVPLLDPELIQRLQVSELWPMLKKAQRQVKTLRARWRHRRDHASEEDSPATIT